MAKLRNTGKLFDLAENETITVGNNRTVTRRKYGKNGFGFQCKLHGHGIVFVGIEGASGIAKVTLNDCGYMTRTTADAMADFARAFGCSLAVSIAKQKLAFKFKNAAGHYVSRDGAHDAPNGPYAMGRYS